MLAPVPSSMQGDQEALTGTTTGVAYGEALTGYTDFNPATGWSPVEDVHSTLGYADQGGDLSPGTMAPHGLTLANTRMLSDGSVWTLWQPGGSLIAANLPAVATRTLRGRLISRVRIDPRFPGTRTKPGVRPPQLAAGQCQVPRQETSEGIVDGLANANANVMYAVTNPDGRFVCRTKFVMYTVISLQQTFIVSFDGGRRWHRIASPRGHKDPGAGSFLAVNGRSFDYGYDLGCKSPQDSYVERYAGGRWHAVGCRPLAASDGGFFP